MLIESKITSKGQTTIPREVREHLGLHEGDRIAYVLEEGRVVVVPRNRRLIDLVGSLGPPPNGPKTLEEIKEGIAEAWAEAGAAGLSDRR